MTSALSELDTGGHRWTWRQSGYVCSRPSAIASSKDLDPLGELGTGVLDVSEASDLRFQWLRGYACAAGGAKSLVGVGGVARRPLVAP